MWLAHGGASGTAYIDGYEGSMARFVNHSCSPNCEMRRLYVKALPRLVLYAGIEGVKKNQEITFDYKSRYVKTLFISERTNTVADSG